MSQAKVDRYKQEKANRKKTMARNKVKRILGIIAGWVVAIALIAWIGVSGYNSWKAKQPIDKFYVNGEAFEKFYEKINPQEETEESSEEGSEETESTESTETEE